MDMKTVSNKQPLSDHSFRLGSALNLLEQCKPDERIMLKGRWQSDSNEIRDLSDKPKVSEWLEDKASYIA
jgi:hypothetical protein